MSWLISYLRTGVQVVIAQVYVRLQQIGLYSSWGLNGHFGSILEDGHWKLVTRQTGEPKAEVPVHLEY